MEKVKDPNQKLHRLFRDLDNVRKGKIVGSEPAYIREGDHLSADITPTNTADDSDV